MSQASKVFTDGQLAELIALRNSRREYQQIADAMNRKYGAEWSAESIRRAYNKYGSIDETAQQISDIKVLKDLARTKRNASHTAKESRTVLQALLNQDDILEQVREAAKLAGRVKVPRVPRARRSRARTDLTVEALLSDIHIGYKTKEFDLEVCRRRLRQYTQVLLAEVARKQAHYNVERVVLALLGDLLGNALFHGRESTMACEFGNPEQVRWTILLLWEEVLLPLAQLGLPVDVVCVGGNHDREAEEPTFQDPGKNSLTWIVYQTLKLLCETSKLRGFTWHIPDGVFQVLEIYGDHILYEHGDRIKGGNDKRSFLNHLVIRSAQLGLQLKGLRLGHWHEFTCYDNGRVIVNGCVPGADSYAEVNGYSSVPVQVINYYVRTANRDNAYYHTTPVQLGSA